MNKNGLVILSVIPFIVAAAPKTPQGGIVRPKTSVVVTHPSTSGPSAVRPVTQVVVTHPQSSEVVVSRPSTAEAEAAVTQNASVPSAGKGVSSGNTIPSGKSSTSMSDFKGKQAADFKAAQVGKTSFDLGNGKQDSAKDSTAKNSNAFKGQLSNVNGGLEKAMKGNGNVSKSKITNKIKKAGK